MVSSGCGETFALYALNLDLQHETQRLISTIVSTSLFGILTSLALASTYIIIGKGVRIRSSQLLLAATVILYASTTIAWVANVRGSLTYTRQATLAAQAVAVCDAQTFLNPMQPSRVYDRMMCIQTATLTINIVIGDSIVWWRALMLWAGRSRYVVLTIGLVLILSTFAMSTADTIQACNLDLVRREAGYGQLFSGTKIGAAASILSLLTNGIATLLTAYKAWRHAKLLRTYFTEGTAMTNVERILILLTESGLTYSTIWLLVTIYQIGINMGDAYDTATFGDNYWGVVGYFVNGGLVGTIAIYPMTIIVLVALKKSQMSANFTHSAASSNTLPVLSTQVPMSPISPESGRSRRLTFTVNNSVETQRRDSAVSTAHTTSSHPATIMSWKHEEVVGFDDGHAKGHI